MNIRVTHRNYQDAVASQRKAEAGRLYKLLDKYCAEFNAMKFKALHGRKIMRHYMNEWKLHWEAKLLQNECADIISLRRRQRLLGTMLDGWRRASAAASARRAEPGIDGEPGNPNDITKLARKKREAAHAESPDDDAETVEHMSDDSMDEEEDEGDGRGGDRDADGSNQTPAVAAAGKRKGATPTRKSSAAPDSDTTSSASKLQSLEQRMWWQFHERSRAKRAAHAQRVALLHRDMIAEHKRSEQALHKTFEQQARNETRAAVDALRKREQELFEKEAAEFKALLQKDIDYVEKMAAEFELKAEKALAERRQQLTDERRATVEKLYVCDVRSTAGKPRF